MSGQCTGWVLRNGPQDRAMRAVLLVIADAANRDGDHARPGMQAIVEGALYSEGHVRRTIAKLVEEGWVEQTAEPGPGKVAEYRVPMENAAHLDARRTPRTMRGVEGQRRANAAQTPRAETRGVPKGAPLVALTETETKGSAALVAESDPVQRYAQQLTVLAFEQPVKPELRDGGRGAFPAAKAIIERVLRAGTPVGEVEGAIRAGVEVWTLAGLQTAIAKTKQRASGNDPLTGRHARPLGQVLATAMGGGR